MYELFHAVAPVPSDWGAGNGSPEKKEQKECGVMETIFEKINGDDEIFKNPEYISDSIIFNAIESARGDDSFNIFTDHKNVIISTPKNGNRVWIWTSSSIKSDTSKLVSICRFLRDCNIPKVEIYVKQDISGNLSDLYAITSLDLDYVVKDEFSLAVFTYQGDKKTDTDSKGIIRIDKDDPEHLKLINGFYSACKDEFRWNDRFERKVNEYLNMELYAYVENGRILAIGAIGSHTQHYIRITSIAVLKEERRRGLGYKMCSFIVDRILENGKTPMLYAHIGNAAGMALWKKTGFKLRDKLYLLKIEDSN